MKFKVVGSRALGFDPPHRYEDFFLTFEEAFKAGEEQKDHFGLMAMRLETGDWFDVKISEPSGRNRWEQESNG